jgi:folate-binding protein YgfZ
MWLRQGEPIEGLRCSREALEMIRVEQGYPWYGIDISEENLPQEVDRNAQAISFTKGCYLGQEPVARIDALGHVNKVLGGVTFTGEELPTAGRELWADGKVVGQVTSAGWSPRLARPLALAYLRRGFQAAGVRLTSNLGEATVVALPLRDSDHV